MAIELVTAPTGGAPLSTNDYDAQNNYIQAAINRLLADQLHLIEWDTIIVPKIAQGVYIQHGGALFQVNDSDESITGAPVNGRVYIKLTRAGNVLTAAFVNSAVGYSWNYVYNGFYHADGTQLLPYILWKTAAGYKKFSLEGLENIFDITSLLHKEIEIEIGDWNMNVSGAGTGSVNISYPSGIDYSIVKSLKVTIRQDSDGWRYPMWWHNLAGGNSSGYWDYNSSDITLVVHPGSDFDNVSYNATSYNRGWIILFIIL